MNKIFLVMGFSLVLCGCASVSKCTPNQDPVKIYPVSTTALKVELSGDLRSNKIGIGTTLDQIKSAYGEPDDILVTACTIRATYRPEKLKSITLWFDDGKLTGWSN